MLLTKAAHYCTAKDFETCGRLGLWATFTSWNAESNEVSSSPIALARDHTTFMVEEFTFFISPLSHS